MEEAGHVFFMRALESSSMLDDGVDVGSQTYSLHTVSLFSHLNFFFFLAGVSPQMKSETSLAVLLAIIQLGFSV